MLNSLKTAEEQKEAGRVGAVSELCGYCRRDQIKRTDFECCCAEHKTQNKRNTGSTSGRAGCPPPAPSDHPGRSDKPQSTPWSQSSGTADHSARTKQVSFFSVHTIYLNCINLCFPPAILHVSELTASVRFLRDLILEDVACGTVWLTPRIRVTAELIKNAAAF